MCSTASTFPAHARAPRRAESPALRTPMLRPGPGSIGSSSARRHARGLGPQQVQVARATMPAAGPCGRFMGHRWNSLVSRVLADTGASTRASPARTSRDAGRRASTCECLQPVFHARQHLGRPGASRGGVVGGPKSRKACARPAQKESEVIGHSSAARSARGLRRSSSTCCGAQGGIITAVRLCTGGEGDEKKNVAGGTLPRGIFQRGATCGLGEHGARRDEAAGAPSVEAALCCDTLGAPPAFGHASNAGGELPTEVSGLPRASTASASRPPHQQCVDQHTVPPAWRLAAHPMKAIS